MDNTLKSLIDRWHQSWYFNFNSGTGFGGADDFTSLNFSSWLQGYQVHWKLDLLLWGVVKGSTSFWNLVSTPHFPRLLWLMLGACWPSYIIEKFERHCAKLLGLGSAEMSGIFIEFLWNVGSDAKMTWLNSTSQPWNSSWRDAATVWDITFVFRVHIGIP